MQEARLRELYERYGAQVYRRCCFLLGDGDEAWDATQEVFLKAEQGLDGFGGRSSLLRWLDRITTNHCLNLLRSRKVRQGTGRVDPADLEAALLPSGGPPGVRVEREDALLVARLLDQFDEQTQRLALAYFVDELSQAEVATEAGLSIPTVRKRLRQFLEQARRLLQRGPSTATARLGRSG